MKPVWADSCGVGLRAPPSFLRSRSEHERTSHPELSSQVRGAAESAARPDVISRGRPLERRARAVQPWPRLLPRPARAAVESTQRASLIRKGRAPQVQGRPGQPPEWRWRLVVPALLDASRGRRQHSDPAKISRNGPRLSEIGSGRRPQAASRTRAGPTIRGRARFSISPFAIRAATRTTSATRTRARSTRRSGRVG